VARTIADLADAQRVTSAHLAESVGYRMRATCPMGQLDRVSPTPVRCVSNSDERPKV
jgi:hypothetical protein